ncbi:uroporphyrinogen-III C-methyltransferase [Nitrosovibrio sp. Nv17]|uniref:uroporphyrinogen-III C-methyltransferase n=1 Tax=Nitrosovibrio sp. Nv17 TaxID=1855339 RepID=UPI000908FB06|nr:uroporphyrinogen-III C-methyltransferase [Nitrosovibrio sp. Nv17]SFW28050.1 uroporphyrin-3 C-methyltransferase [Nitrosovibrio sp. Nv17]
MNEEIRSTDSPDPARVSPGAAPVKSPSDPPQEPGRKDPASEPRQMAALVVLALVFFTAMAWQWYDTRSHVADLRLELGRRLAQADASGKMSHELASEAAAGGHRLAGRLDQLEARVAESQSQQLALEALYQELTRNRDEVALEEIEQLLLIADRQLQLAGNVKAALIAMQEADTRLQRLDRPQLSSLRGVLAQDMDALKAVPHTDSTEISLHLARLAAAAMELPLAMDSRPPAPAAPSTEAHAAESTWLGFLHEIWKNIRQLVHIQRTDQPDAILLSPSEAYFLRENLKLRLLSARLAMLARDMASFRIDIDDAIDMIRRYYDSEAQGVIVMLDALNRLRDNSSDVELPRISASLDAIRSHRLAQERKNR